MSVIKNRNRVLRDKNWAKAAFRHVPGHKPGQNAKLQRGVDKSEIKFYDTTPGGYRAINPLPQFTRFSDIKRKNRNTNSRGMGRYYSNVIDDGSHIIHLRAGLPETNGLTTFLGMAYEPSAAKLARTGETSSFLSEVAGLIGNIFLLPLVPLIHGWRALKSIFSDAPNNRFYYSKPAMPLYYNAVNMMLVKIAVDMKLIAASEPKSDNPSKVQINEGNEKETYNSAFKIGSILSESDRKTLNGAFPEIFDEDYGFDIRKMSTRYQRLYNQDAKERNRIATLHSGADDYFDKLAEYYSNPVTDPAPDTRLGPYLERYLNSGLARTSQGEIELSKAAQEAGKSGEAQAQISESYKASQSVVSKLGQWWEGAYEHLLAEFREGSQWVSIRVNHVESRSESFSNATEESGLAQSLKASAQSSASRKFNFANGNIGDGLGSDIVESIFGAVNETVAAIGSSVGVSAIGAMLGGGIIDIPKYWTDSSANLPGGSYKVELRAYHGNKLSIFKNIYIPLAMILCLALPKAAGPSAYTSPFLVEVFDPGHWQDNLTVMENLTINRGVGNIPWMKADDGGRLPLGVDVEFDLVSLSTILSMSVGGSSFSFNDRNPYIDYMAALANKHPLDQLSAFAKMDYKRKIFVAEWQSKFSMGYVAQLAADTPPGKVVRALSKLREF